MSDCQMAFDNAFTALTKTTTYEITAFIVSNHKHHSNFVVIVY